MNGWVSIYQLSSVLKTCRWSLHSAPNGSFVSVRSFAMSSTFLEVIVFRILEDYTDELVLLALNSDKTQSIHWLLLEGAKSRRRSLISTHRQLYAVRAQLSAGTIHWLPLAKSFFKNYALPFQVDLTWISSTKELK